MPAGPKEFCKITKYLELKNKALFELYNNYCLLHIFSDRDRTGLTLLEPDKKYLKYIIDLAYNKNKPHDAIKHLKACVIKSYVKDISEFSSKLLNSNDTNLEVESATKDHAVLKGGLKIKTQPLYKQLYEGGKYAVFQLTGSGMLNISGAKSNPKAGGRQGQEVDDYSSMVYDNKPLVKFVEDYYADNHPKIYKLAVLALLNANGSSLEFSNDDIVPCGTARSTFYSNLEKFKTAGIDDANFVSTISKLFSGDNGDSSTSSNINDIIDKYDKKLDNYKNDKNKPITDVELETIIKKNNQHDIWEAIIAHYKNSNNSNWEIRLHSDLLTVLCFICAHNEATDDKPDSDPKSVYNICSTSIIKKYNSFKDFKPTSDIAFDYTILMFLLKTNIFDWPNNVNGSRYTGYYDPHSNPFHQQYFNITGHSSTVKSGGDASALLFGT
jgi:hypothetical protein